MHAGLIGLGNMGGAIAERLLGQGVTLHVCDLDPVALDRARLLGAIVHPTPQAVADTVSTVIGCLPTVPAARHVLLGPDGIVGGAAVRYYAEMSTIGPAAARDHAAAAADKGCHFIDAAVSGGSAAALGGTLAIMASGDPAGMQNVQPLFTRLTDRLFIVGDSPGQAQAMKLVNNLLAAANMATSFEALTFGVSLGLNPAIMVDVINAGSGRNTGLVDRRVAAILSRRFDSGPKIALLAKDIDLAFGEAKACGFPLDAMPALQGMSQLWQRAVDAGMASDDVSALIQIVERAAGVQVGSGDETAG